MASPRGTWRDDEEDEAGPVGHTGYYSLSESMIDDPWEEDDPDFVDERPQGQGVWPALWDRGIDILTAHSTRFWAIRGAAAFLFLLILIVIWLAITAPLSKSLEPIAPPQITLLAADGTPSRSRSTACPTMW